MKEPTSIHREAMAIVDDAVMAKLRGDHNLFSELMCKALEKEVEAASLIAGDFPFEPTRSVLYRSAASIALQCNKTREAEKLISNALSGNPPDEIADELRDLLEEINFRRHLEVRGIELEPNEFQLSIAGDDVGYGYANSSQFIERIKDLRTLIYRTAERIEGITFDESGTPKASLRREFELYVSMPRAGSFAVSLRLGQLIQRMLPGTDRTLDIINELFECVDLYSGDNIILKNRISDPSYYRNFVALTRRIAPDGKRIKLVGLTSIIGKKKRQVVLAKPRSDYVLKEYEIEKGKEEKIITIKGILDYADATSIMTPKIKIIDEKNHHHIVNVPPGMMNDIVRPMWGAEVIVVGEIRRDLRRRREIIIDLKKIDKFSE